MAHRRRSRSKNKSKSHSRKHRNPFLKRRRGSRRNPQILGLSAKQVIELGLGAAGGVIGAGYLSQMVLGGSNVGVMGYAADTVSTLVLAWVANKFASGDVAKGVLAGGIGAVIKRIWTDNVSGGSGSVSGLGNLEFAGLGGLGVYKNQSFPLPTSSGQYALQAAAGAAVGSGGAASPNPAVATSNPSARSKRW